MQLTLNISEADFGAELKDIMSSLSIEEKKEIAKEIFIKSLNEVTDTQRTIKEKEESVLQGVRNSLSSYDKDKYTTIDQLRGHYKYKELMGTTKSLKEQTID